MNKLFTKIASLSVGLALAVGVGVAVGSQKGALRVKADTTEFTLSSASAVTKDGVTVSFDKGSGSSAPAWYAAGLRLYVSNTVTISSSNTITGVTFNWEKQGSKAFASVTADVGDYTHPSAAGEGVWSGSETSIVFTLGSSGQLQLNTLSVDSGSSTTTYTVSYNSNGGTGTMTDSNEYDSGDTVTVMYCQFMPADSYHEFNSFNTKADGSGDSYMGGGTFTITKNTTLYAIWDVKEATLPNGSYTSTLTYANPMPSELDVLDGEKAKCALLTLESDGMSYKDNYSEFDLAANKYLTIVNHSNAVITKVLFEVYNFDNIDVFVDGSETYMHHGDGSNVGDHTKIELNVNAESSVKIVSNGGSKGTYSQSFYGLEVYMRVGAEPIHPTGVELNAESGFVYIGKTRTLTATVSPADADDKTVAWSTSNGNVATVSDAGVVTGVAEGEATITATTNDGGFTASFIATVKEINYGTAENPLSLEEARDVIEVTGSEFSAQELYVKGVVSTSKYDTSHSNYTIWLKNSDATVEKYFELYGTTIVSTITDDYTAQNALAGLTVVCHGYGKYYSGTYELAFKDTSYPEITSISYTAEKLAALIISETKATCDAYEDESHYAERKATFEGIWDNLAAKYATLSDDDKDVLIEAERSETGTAIEQAMARYDYLTGKYQLDNFITGRTPMQFQGHFDLTETSNNNTMIIIVVIASVSAISLATLLILKKKKHN